MAGRGPAPKRPGQRHGHRTKAEEATQVLSIVDRVNEPPPLPAWCADVCPEVHEWYDAWCKSPQAEHFLPTDWTRLHQLALIVDLFHRSQSFERPKILGEIRLNESLLGATATDRLRLRWEVKPPGEPSKLEGIRRRIKVTDDG
jgi:hypothetical protein